MFERDTTLIVGAGASKEFNLPVGAELRDRISEKLNILYSDGATLSKGDRHINHALIALSESERGRFSELQGAAWSVRDGVKQAVSIDSFLDTHRSNPDINICGKLAILSAIIEAEFNSTLYVEPNYRPAYPFNEIRPLDTVRGTWLDYFFQKLADGVTKENVSRIFDKISIVTFNYDRTVEHFLYLSLQNYFRIEPVEAAQVMAELNIFHPYGSVAPLEWMNTDRGVTFGGVEGASNPLTSLTQNIQTYTESQRDPYQVDMAKAKLSQAENIIFLGFAFHRQNMALLKTRMQHRPLRVFSSSYGVSSSDCEQIREDLLQHFGRPKAHIRFHMGNQLTCTDVFTEFARGMMS